jgi:hypothetical protein
MTRWGIIIEHNDHLYGVLFAVLLLLLVFVRRRHYDASWEDGADEHSRDTLGTYSEEGGGEGDTVTYDPNLLKVSLLDDGKRRKGKNHLDQQANGEFSISV